jgi:hypothetical protein
MDDTAAASAASSDHTLALTTPPVAPVVPKKWKLKNAVGLVYDFTDAEQLVRWLGSKDNHDGFSASDNVGKEFKQLSEFDELRDVRPSRSKTMMGMSAVNISQVLDSPSTSSHSGLHQRPTTGMHQAVPPVDKEKLQAQAQARLSDARRARGITDAGSSRAQSAPKRENPRIRRQEPEPAKNNSGIILASLVILPLLALVALNMLEVINIRDLLGGSPGGRYADQIPDDGVFAPAADPNAAPVGNDPVRPAPIELTPEQQVARLIELAGSSLTARDYDSALGHLERASFLEPENVELKCQLVDIYERAQRPADAARAAAACDAGTAAAEGSAAPAEASAPTDVVVPE